MEVNKTTCTSMEIPKNNEDYRKLDYWDKRYKDEDSYDWFTGYDSFKDLLVRDISKSDLILNLGCGNSRLSELMYRDGFKHIINTDFSPTVIEKMAEKYRDFLEMTWRVMDIRDIKFAAASFDVIIEKGTLDALLVHEKDPWAISAESLVQIENILEQVSSCLKHHGKFISITFAQPHFRRQLYACSKFGWSVEVKTFGNSFHYYYYVMVKGQELCLKDKAAEEKRKLEEFRTESADNVQKFCEPDSEDFVFNIQV